MASALSLAMVWAVGQMLGLDAATLEAGMLAATVGAMSTVISLLPVVVASSWGLMAAVAGYFAGAALRMIICLAVVMALVWRAGVDPTAPALMLMSVYLPLMLLEAGLVGQYLWPLQIEREEVLA